jgi:signal peptidase II
LKRSWIIASIVALVLLVDQALKIYIKTHFEYGEEHRWADWAMLKFVENEGMAFGMTLGGIYGKLALSVFRLIAVTLLFFYIKRLLETRAPLGFIACVALILAGALGNILDSMFYGLIFSDTPFHGGVAEFTSFGKGYDEFLFGKVVDMLHFPMLNFQIPASIPLLGGQEFTFFSFIFNIADAAISVGVFSILLFQRRFFKESENFLVENNDPNLEKKSPENTLDEISENTEMDEDLDENRANQG